MDEGRGWFSRFHPKTDRFKVAPASNKNGAGGSDSGKELSKSGPDEIPSDITKQKVAAAKQFIESHYKAQTKNLQERKERVDLKHKHRRGQAQALGERCFHRKMLILLVTHTRTLRLLRTLRFQVLQR